MQRHPVLVSGAAAGVVLGLSLALGAALLGRANAELRQKKVDLANEQARTRDALQAEAKRRQEARAALDAQTSFVMEDLLGRQPVVTDEHKHFLRQALQAHEQFAANTGQEEEGRAGVARAHWRVGRIRHPMDIAAEAEKAHRQAITLYEQLSLDFPTVSDYRRDPAGSSNNLAMLLQEQRQLAATRAAFEQALSVRKHLALDYPDEPAYRRDLAASYNSLGYLLREQEEQEAARAAHEQALSIHRQLALEFPSSATTRAAADAEAGVQSGKETADMVCHAAHVYALSAATLTKEAPGDSQPTLAGARRKELVQEYAGRAMELLKQAVRHGYKDGKI